MSLFIDIKDIRNIKKASIELPFEKGMYALVGNNGCGKSTLMLLLSLVIKTSSAHLLTSKDITDNSFVKIIDEDKFDVWKPNTSKKLSTGKYNKNKLISSVRYHGFYEGSIFYGSRFYDYNKTTAFLDQESFEDKLVDADPFVSETLGYILHNDKNKYKSLKRIKSKEIARQEGFIGFPYFNKIGDKVISQYQMSSGESMLISLIDFINNLVRNGNYRKLLFLIDEVELALHPAAIDRLQLYLNKLINDSKTQLVIYFSTHSAELIQRISPKNIYLIENNDGILDVINPCYPNYAIRSLYVPNGFDFILLVEDELAKGIVDKIIRENNLAESKLCCVLPSGGCTQMLKLHYDMITYNTLGTGKRIISIYDGDVKDSISKKDEYKNLPKCFLPIPSVEKYLKKKLLDDPDRVFIKKIGDKYFNQRSLDQIIKDYSTDSRTSKSNDNDGKNFYAVIVANLNRIGISETDFIKYISDDIYNYEKPSEFVNSLRKLLS